MAKNFPRLRSANSEAMSTVGRENFDHQIVFTFDFSDYEMKTREVKKALSDFGYGVSKVTKNLDMDKSSGFIFPTLYSGKSSFAQSNDGIYNSVLNFLPDGKQVADDMNTFAVWTSSEAKSTIQKYIGNRIDTHLMINSVRGQTTRRAKKITSRAGWIDIWHKYFGFQEEGTYQIAPMHAIMRTYLEMAPLISKGMNEYFRNYSRNGGWKGRK